jgi:hypothetical protein
MCECSCCTRMHVSIVTRMAVTCIDEQVATTTLPADMNEIILTSWMDKRGPKPTDAWRRRYFVMTRTEIRYYEKAANFYVDAKAQHKDGHGTPLGLIDLSKALGVAVMSPLSPYYPFGFTVDTPDRTWFLGPPDVSTRDVWLDKLRAVLSARGMGSAGVSVSLCQYCDAVMSDFESEVANHKPTCPRFSHFTDDDADVEGPLSPVAAFTGGVGNVFSHSGLTPTPASAPAPAQVAIAASKAAATAAATAAEGAEAALVASQAKGKGDVQTGKQLSAGLAVAPVALGKIDVGEPGMRVSLKSSRMCGAVNFDVVVCCFVASRVLSQRIPSASAQLRQQRHCLPTWTK